ncbi:phosphoribosyltransferase [Humitalea sp. 24SJ18S-53]|uniref:phosphoribosyltransferase n=1 Tax=Humitalea sp. 24SJ18S-53 TaxID=3422307 RepID=UPI003D67B9A4
MDFWQVFDDTAPPAPWTDAYPATMPDGRVLWLPIRDRGDHAVTGLIANQASFAVARALAGWMTEAARGFGADVVVGLPSQGQVFAPLIAEALGHTNWVAPGWSRKTWYDAALSAPAHSSTSPDARAMWLDPRVLPRLAGRRVLLVDDVLATGASALAGLALLDRAGVRPVAMVAAMLQGDRWRAKWPADVPVVAAFATPVLAPVAGGWGCQ